VGTVVVGAGGAVVAGGSVVEELLLEVLVDGRADDALGSLLNHEQPAATSDAATRHPRERRSGDMSRPG
jgi:hypothetical protein